MSGFVPRFPLNIASTLLAAIGIASSHTALAYTELEIMPPANDNIGVYSESFSIEDLTDSEVIGILSETELNARNNVEMVDVSLDFSEITTEKLYGIKLTNYDNVDLSGINVSAKNLTTIDDVYVGSISGVYIESQDPTESITVQNSEMTFLGFNKIDSVPEISFISVKASEVNTVNILGNQLTVINADFEINNRQLSTCNISDSSVEFLNVSDNRLVFNNSTLSGINAVGILETDTQNTHLASNAFNASNITLELGLIYALRVESQADETHSDFFATNNDINIESLKLSGPSIISSVNLEQYANTGSLNAVLANNAITLNNATTESQDVYVKQAYASHLIQDISAGNLEAISSKNSILISNSEIEGNFTASYVDQTIYQSGTGNVLASDNLVRFSNVSNLSLQYDDSFSIIASKVTQNAASSDSNLSTIATNNIVEIFDSDWASNVYGAIVRNNSDNLTGSAQANGNTITLNNSLVYYVEAASVTNYDNIQVNNNTVIADQVQALGIYGAKAYVLDTEETPSNLEVNDNSVYLYNSSVGIVMAGAIFSGDDTNSATYVGSGHNNTIYVAGVNEVSEINGFDTLVLTADESVNSTQAVLTFSASAGWGYNTQQLSQRNTPTTTLSGKTIVLTGDLENVVFMNSDNSGLSYQFENTTLRYQSEFFESELQHVNFEISDANENSSLTSDSEIVSDLKQNLKTNRASETLSQARVTELAWINQGAEFIADSAMPAAADALMGKDFASFASITGSNVHYETGSYVDMNGFSFAGGLSSRIGEMIVTGFVEYGRANSDQYNDAARGEAEHDYVGIGVAAQKNFRKLRLDAALRLGQSNTDFTGVQGTGYETDSFYVTAHAGAAYSWPITERLSTELYGRYMVSYLDSADDCTGDAFNSRFESEAITSHALRVGARVMGSVEEKLFWKTGLAYEYVFDAETDDTLADYDIESATVDGGSGVLEATVTLKPSAESPWAFEFGAKGYAGTREGITGNLLIKRAF